MQRDHDDTMRKEEKKRGHNNIGSYCVQRT